MPEFFGSIPLWVFVWLGGSILLAIGLQIRYNYKQSKKTPWERMQELTPEAVHDVPVSDKVFVARKIVRFTEIRGREVFAETRPFGFDKQSLTEIFDHLGRVEEYTLRTGGNQDPEHFSEQDAADFAEIRKYLKS